MKDQINTFFAGTSQMPDPLHPSKRLTFLLVLPSMVGRLHYLTFKDPFQPKPFYNSTIL